jgi:putative MATE family efflux protein
MSSQNASENQFLTAPLGRVFAINTIPIIFIMMMSGMLTVIDAAFLGHYVGADALAAVSVVFPILMITIALSALVGGGMSSLISRQLGAGKHHEARAVFAQAHGIALFLSFLLIATFGSCGHFVIDQLTGHQRDLSRMAYSYLGIMILATPVQFVLAVHADAWRNQGRAGLMALVSLGVTLANIALDYVLIVYLDLGVVGSAWGTALAQAMGLVMLVGLRLRSGGRLPLSALTHARWGGGWRAILIHGAPVSLSFIGIALVSATVITTLRLRSDFGYVDSVAAYGIVTRIFSFTFMPLMAIALATQSIVGNNVGAKIYQRSDAALLFALIVSCLYCAVIEIALLSGSHWIGRLFVSNVHVVAQVSEILSPMVSLYVFAGPVLVLALYFQAIGKPGHAAALTLIKPFVLSPALIALLGVFYGAQGIWFAFPIADGGAVVIAILITIITLRHPNMIHGFGVTDRKDAL